MKEPKIKDIVTPIKQKHKILKQSVSEKQMLFLFYLRQGKKPYIDYNGNIQLREMSNINY